MRRRHRMNAKSTTARSESSGSSESSNERRNERNTSTNNATRNSDTKTTAPNKETGQDDEDFWVVASAARGLEQAEQACHKRTATCSSRTEEHDNAMAVKNPADIALFIINECSLD